MNDIICPHCHKAFKIDEAGYADILRQVRDDAFEQQLHERLELAEKDKQSAVDLIRAQFAVELQQAAAAKDAAIQTLQAKVASASQEQQLAVARALGSAEKERDALAHQLAQVQRDHEAAAALAQAQRMAELGISMRGEFRITTDGNVLRHNATEVRQFGTYKVYIWKIENAFSPPPNLVMQRDNDPQRPL